MGFKKLIIFLFLGLLIFGCAKNRGISYPSWYLNSLPNDNAFFMQQEMVIIQRRRLIKL